MTVTVASTVTVAVVVTADTVAVAVVTAVCRATVLIYLQGITAKNFYYSYVKKHRSCWELVGCLFAACSEVQVWEILNCDRTRSNVFVR